MKGKNNQTLTRNNYYIPKKRFQFCLKRLILSCLLTFSIGKIWAQAPVVNYNSSQTYTVGTPIASLKPASSGVATPGYNSSPVSLGSGFYGPNGIGVDQAGNVYVVDNNRLSKIPVGGGAVITYPYYIAQSTTLAVDAAGDCFIGSVTANGAITEIPAGGGSGITFGLPNPAAIAVDAAGNVYATYPGFTNPVIKYTAGSFTPVVISTTPASPFGIAVDSKGNVFLPEGTNIVEIPVDGGNQVTISTNFSQATGIAVDVAGNLYVADFNHSWITELPAGGGSPVVLGSGFRTPYALAVDGAGNIYVADPSLHTPYKIQPNGGFYISAALPAGLNFSTTTGAITATPTAASPATNYIITAYNSSGSSTATVSIAVGAIAAPVIASFSPASGPVGTAVTITGSGFNTVPSGNIVYFGATQAVVSAATVNSLTVTVPAGANFKPLTVLNSASNLTGYASKPFAITFNNAAGQTITTATLGNRTDFTTGTNPFSVAIGDIDGDGKPDIVTANLSANTISVFRNISANGSLNSSSFAAKVDFATGAFPVSVALGDVDGDGKLDIIVANMGSQNTETTGGTVSVFRNTTVSGQINSTSLAPKVDLFAGGNTRSVFIGDIDGDGKPEIVAANLGSNTISVFQNNTVSGSITAQSFATKVDFVAGNSPSWVKLADVDGDGKPDMEVVNGGDLNPGSISIFKNTASPGSISTASFAAMVNFAVNGQATSLDVSDIDGDGKPDIAVSSSYNGGAISLLRNIMTGTGSINTGSFATHVDLSAPNNAQAISITDIDGDGKPELLTANYPGSVSVYQNKSTPGSITTSSFGSNIDFKTVSTGGSLAIGDLDGDGKPDVVATNWNTSAGSISVFKNESVPGVALSYNGSNNYTTGKKINPLIPVGSNVAAPGYSSTLSTLNSGATNPYGVAVDAAGNVYVSDIDSKTIKEVPVGGGSPVTIGSGLLQHPEGVAVDAQGNVYTADYYYPAVREIVKSSGSAVSLGTGFNELQGVAVDAAGNVYVADFGDDPSVKEILKSNGSTLSIGTGFSDYPSQVAVDAAGNVYVADNYDIKEIVKSSGATITLSTGSQAPKGVAVDASGNVYFSDSANGAIQEIMAGGGQVTIFSGLSSPGQIAVDGAGNVYFVDGSSNSVKVIKPSGGYYLNTPLPSGLSFSQSTGIIAGTPTAASPATNYTVTAYNSGGSAKATVTITVLPGANNTALSSILASTNTSVTPATVNGVLGFTTAVGPVATSLTLTPLTADPNATVTVNGASVGNGSPSGQLALTTGATTTINVVVTAADGVTTQTYPVNVTRGPADNAILSALANSAGTPFTFSPDNTGAIVIRTTVPVSALSLTPTTSDPAATVTINGTAVNDNSTSAPITLNATSTTTIPLVVTAADGVTTKTYTVAIDRQINNNASLQAISASTGTKMVWALNGTVWNISTSVGQTPTSISFTPTPQNPYASITINGIAAANGALSAAIPLNANASTIITLVVTASDGVTKQTYPITVSRGASTNTALSWLGFSPNTTQTGALVNGLWTISVTEPTSVSFVVLTPTTVDPNVTVTINGTTVANKTASSAFPLNASGTTYFTMVITAADGITTQLYPVTVHKAGSNASLYKNRIDLLQSDSTVLATNLLTPNGDGVNDTWTIKNIENYPNNQVTVYDRTGNMVYSKKGYANDWAGTYRGSVLNEGTYYYLVDLGNGSSLKGFITVVRDR